MIFSDEMNTEILATMGPTLGLKSQLITAMNLGVSNFRIHMGVRSRDRCQYFLNVREAEKVIGKHVEVLIDLPTAKPRVGIMKSVKPSVGDVYKVIESNCTDKELTIPLIGIKKLLGGLNKGDRVVFADKKIVFRIVKKNDREIFMKCVCANANLVSQISSCVFPDSEVEFDIFDQDDLVVLKRMKKHMLYPDWIAISFASGVQQINAIKEVVGGLWGERIRYMAKIESKKGLQNIDEIIKNVDGIMVARGDLLSFIEPYALPYIQQSLVNRARKYRKAVVVATEMLEHFSSTGIIHRPELSDIALAIRQGASAVMLSVESANSSRVEECITLVKNLIMYEKEQVKNGEP